jgi:hypothetical protein
VTYASFADATTNVQESGRQTPKGVTLRFCKMNLHAYFLLKPRGFVTIFLGCARCELLRGALRAMHVHHELHRKPVDSYARTIAGNIFTFHFAAAISNADERIATQR